MTCKRNERRSKERRLFLSSPLIRPGLLLSIQEGLSPDSLLLFCSLRPSLLLPREQTRDCACFSCCICPRRQGLHHLHNHHHRHHHHHSTASCISTFFEPNAFDQSLSSKQSAWPSKSRPSFSSLILSPQFPHHFPFHRRLDFSWSTNVCHIGLRFNDIPLPSGSLLPIPFFLLL